MTLGAPTPGSPFDAGWNGSGGDPGGFVSVINTALDAVLTDIALIAPSKYLGDQGAAFGQTLTFSLRAPRGEYQLRPTWLLLSGSLGALSLVRRRLISH